MGIYISGVKGLPEQVQENKNKIKEVEEQIEGIDFEAVRELQGQVAENTQDINTIENNIGLQSQAITTLNENLVNEVNERKDLIDLTEGDADIKKENVKITTIKSKSNVFDINVLGTSDDEAEFNIYLINDGVQAHNLFFSTEGNLLIDGNPVGGGTEYKSLSFVLYQNTGRTYNVSFMLEEKTTDSINTYASIRNKLYNSGATSNNYLYAASGYFLNASNEVNIVYGMYADGQGAGNSIVLVGFNITTLQRTQTLTTAANDYLHRVELDFNN